MKKLIPTIILLLISTSAYTEWSVPIVRNVPGGTQSAVVVLPDNKAHAFMLDTGAGYTLIGRKTFNTSIKHIEGVYKTRTVTGTAATGERVKVNLYMLPYLEFSSECRIENLEFGVISGNDKNMIGMNIFEQISPFTLDYSEQTLTGRNCGN